MLFTALNVVLDGPGRKLGDLGDVGDLRELSPSFSSPGFRLGPACKVENSEMKNSEISVLDEQSSPFAYCC